jgi:small subunit ribosomal protein S2
LAEAKRLGIQTFGIVDTNCDPNKVDFAIPGNDDATKSIAILTNYIVAAIAEGLAERQAAKDEDTDENVEESAEERARRFEAQGEGEGGGRRGGRGTEAPGAGGPKRRTPSAGNGGRKPSMKK